MKRHLLPGLFLLLLTYGCDGGSGGGRDAGDGGGSGDETWANVHPPANIDIKSCTTIVDDSTDGILDKCSACCSSAGYVASGFINHDHCTCANPESTICPTPATNQAECSTCCLNGYSGYVFGTNMPCTCQGKKDSQICAVVLTRKNPSEQCSLCCLNNGFLGSGYWDIGTPDCTCTSP